MIEDYCRGMFVFVQAIYQAGLPRLSSGSGKAVIRLCHVPLSGNITGISMVTGEEVALVMHTNLVCSRALFEFFIGTGSNDVHIVDLNIPTPYKSRRYKNIRPPRPNAWKEPINRHISHISIGRTGSIQGKHGPTNVIGKYHLKNMMPKFKDEIL